MYICADETARLRQFNRDGDKALQSTMESKAKKPLSFNVGVSKGQSRREKVSEKKSVFGQDDFGHKEDEVGEEKDFILGAEGSIIKSKKEKPKEKELVIPMIKNNRWRTQGKGDNDMDAEAAEEILQELRNESDTRKEGEKLTIPLLMQNRLPGVSELQSEAEVYSRDVELRPSESNSADYEQVPVTSFGSAILRGMGWKQGEPIGLTNKGLAEPIEYIPRFKGLGLGAERRPEERAPRKRKLGEKEDPAKRYAPIIEKDGRVRHVKGLDEKVKERPKGFVAGGLICIEKGSHTGHYGKIVAVDEDNARITLKLALSNEVVTISQYHATLVDEDEYKAQAKVDRNNSSKERSADNRDDAKRGQERLKREDPEASKSGKAKDEGNLSTQPSWLAPGIRVRIISDKYKKGRYYNKKVKILDVVSRDACTCIDQNKVLEGLRVSDLETVVPKGEKDHVLCVSGKYKGQFAKIIDRHQSKCRATVQLLSNKHVTKVSYDDISEFVGDLPDELFLD